MIESATKAFDLILKARIIAILRDVPSGRIVPAARALIDGGVRCLEVTYDAGSAEKSADALKSIAALEKEFGDGIALGAGTVLTPGQVRDAAQAGAAYILSPNTYRAVIRATKESGLLSIPGALTPTEILCAWDWGADAVKIFPASAMGPDYIRAVRSPIRHIPLLAVGGVTPGNTKSYLDAGCAGVGAGGNLVDTGRIAVGDYDAIRALARAFADVTVHARLADG